jgi:hypothetical protein
VYACMNVWWASGKNKPALILKISGVMFCFVVVSSQSESGRSSLLFALWIRRGSYLTNWFSDVYTNIFDPLHVIFTSTSAWAPQCTHTFWHVYFWWRRSCCTSYHNLTRATPRHVHRLSQNHIKAVFLGREFTNYTVISVVYKLFWPTLHTQTHWPTLADPLMPCSTYEHTHWPTLPTSLMPFQHHLHTHQTTSLPVFFLVRYTISIDMKTWVSDIWNRFAIKLLGMLMSPCVKRFCGPWEAVEGPHTPQIPKNFRTVPNS